MGHRHGPGRHRREDRSAGSLTQPVQRFARRRRGDDRVVNPEQGGRDLAVRTGHQFRAAAREHTTITERTLVALVLATTQPTDVRRHRSKTGTVTAHRRSRPWRRDEAPLLPAVLADSPPTQRGGVTGVAHRALCPVHGRRSVRAAVRTNRCRSGKAPLARRGSERDELARSVTTAGRARGERQLVAVDADVGRGARCPHTDRRHLVAAPAAAAGPVGRDVVARAAQRPAAGAEDDPSWPTAPITDRFLGRAHPHLSVRLGCARCGRGAVAGRPPGKARWLSLTERLFWARR